MTASKNVETKITTMMGNVKKTRTATAGTTTEEEDKDTTRIKIWSTPKIKTTINLASNSQ